MYKVGLDVHKRTITGALVDFKGNLHEKTMFRNSLSDLDKFLYGLPIESTEIGMNRHGVVYLHLSLV